MIEKNAQRQLAYYWFPQRGRILHNLFELKLYAFWDALIKQRTDGALVRIMTPISANESVQEADARIAAFVRETAPLLDQYIPGKDI
jgi:EpsI family protein